MNTECRPADVEAFRAFAARRLGLHFDDARLAELAGLLSRRMLVAKEQGAAYLDRLDGPGARPEELRILAHELTVHETYFFRHAEQFRAFAAVVLPDRIRANRPHGRLRVLSAGCASGEEPYSLAILAAQSAEAAGSDLSIRGIDVSAAAIEAATRGRYSAWSLRETPEEVRSRYFTAHDRDFVLDPAIRRLVTFEEHNLAGLERGPLEPEAFDIIFCRNVIMYFTPEAARATVARLSRSLVPGGFLFLGHAETLRGLSQDFHLRQSNGTFYYQRREADEAPRPSLGSQPAASTLRPGPAVEAESPSEVPLPDDSWVDIIRRASERIQSLTGSPRATARPVFGAEDQARQRAGQRLGPALDLLQGERYPEAAALLEALPAEAAVDPDVLLLRAVLLTHGGDLARAEQLSLDLLAQDELSAGAHYVLALCRENAGDQPGAMDHDRAALYLDPAFAMPRLHLGLLARRSGDRDQARREFQDALVLLRKEDSSRVLMFGGGFHRDALIALCQAELASCGGRP